MASSSSAAAALSLYEKYTQLNRQLDETRETRSSLQKQVQDTRERLDEYETLHKPALRQSTQNLHDETEYWQEQLSSAQEEAIVLQSQRDALARSRDRLEQVSSARQEKQRAECRNFLAESRHFRERHCPQLHLQLSMMTSMNDAALDRNASHIRLLRAVALASGQDDEKLPQDVLADIPTKSLFDELEIPAFEDDIDWNLWDAAFGDENDVDNEHILQKLSEFKNQRKLFETSQLTLHKAKEHLRVEVADKYETHHRYKEQLEAKLKRLSKEIQQLEVEISTTLAVRCIGEEEEIAASPPAPHDSVSRLPRVSLSPPKEPVMNPYRRQTNQSSGGTVRCNTRVAAPPPPPPPPQVDTTSRPRHGSSRKRKSAFGSSMEIGGAEVWSLPDTPSVAATKRIQDDFLESMEDTPEDDELLSFTPFRRQKR